MAGASGVGRHHANWHARLGAEVVAFLGSSEERCQRTRGLLSSQFGFSGRGYTEIGELLSETRPDIVDVCTPNDLHFDVVHRSLAAGCHVLCEKPLVWVAPFDADGTIQQGRELADRAREAKRHLGLCTQYAMAIPQWRRLSPDWCPDRLSRFEAELETLARGRQRDAASVWIDMGSHPLSLVLAVLPSARIEEASLRVQYRDREARVEFLAVDGLRRCECRIVVRDRVEGTLVRRFGFDGIVVDCAARPDASGVYQSVLRRGGTEDVGDDYMHQLIRQFHRVAATPELEPAVSAEIALRNLAMQVQVHQAA